MGHRQFVLASFLCVLLCAKMEAASISVFNHSFELTSQPGDAPEGDILARVAAGGSSNTSLLPGWTVAPNLHHRGGQFNPSDAFFSGTTGNPAPAPADNTHVAHLHFGGGAQDSDISRITSTNALTTIQAGVEYTATVAIGLPKVVDPPTLFNPPFRAKLIWFADGAAVVETVLNFRAGVNSAGAPLNPLPVELDEFKDFQVVMNSATSTTHAGKELKLQMWLRSTNTSGGGNMLVFDNVRVEDSTLSVVIPEPSGLGIAIIGLLGLAMMPRRHWRRRQ